MSISVETLALAKKFSKTYTDTAIEALPNGIVYRGAVNYYSDLPNDAEEGDAYTVKYTGASGTTPDGTEYVWGNDSGTLAWIAIGPDLSQYQEKLVSGENIKTINGTSVLGNGDLHIGTNYSFPDAWSSYTSSSTSTRQFCDIVNADSGAVMGMSYLGEVRWNDLPFNGNAEVVVEIMSGTGTSGKVIHLILTSGNVAPYRWEYTYWSNGTYVSGWIPNNDGVMYATVAPQSANTSGDLKFVVLSSEPAQRYSGYIYLITGA